MPPKADPEADFANDLADYFAAHPVVNLAFLFGSVERGDAGFESDLDVAVEGDAPLTATQKKAMIEKLAALSGRPVDLVDLRRVGGALRGQVLRTGRRLHCASNTHYARLIKRHLYDQADWQPYRKRILRERRKRWIEDS